MDEEINDGNDDEMDDEMEVSDGQTVGKLLVICRTEVLSPLS